MRLTKEAGEGIFRPRWKTENGFLLSDRINDECRGSG